MNERTIGSHVLQPNRQLLKHGERVSIGPRALTILSILAERAGDVVTKDELLEAVWPSTVVEENALQVHIAALRKALGEDATALETIRGVGYVLHDAPVSDAQETQEGTEPDEPSAPSPAVSKAADQPLAPTPDAEKPAKPNQAPWKLAALGVLAILAAIPAALFVFGGWGPSPTDESEVPASRPPSLVVLPFSVRGMDEDPYLGSALASTLSSDLGRLPGLRVIAVTSAQAMAQQSLTASEMSERFGIDFIVEGEVSRIGDRLVGTLRLVEAETSTQLWSDTIDTSADALPVFQGRLGLSLSRALASRLNTTSLELASDSSINPEAFRAYLRGIDAMNYPDYVPQLRREGYRSLTRAVELDPDFADAWAARAELLLRTFPKEAGLRDNEEKMVQVAADVERALELDPDNLAAKVVSVAIELGRTGDVERAQEIVNEVLARDPNNLAAHFAMSNIFFAVADGARMREWQERRFQLDPFTVTKRPNLRVSLYRIGDYESLKRFLDECELCAERSQYYLTGLVGLATPEQIQRDRPDLAPVLRESLSQDEAKAAFQVLDAIAQGEPVALEDVAAMYDEPTDRSLDQIALAAWFGAPSDEVFNRIDRFLDDTKFDTRIFSNILVDSRISIPPKLRADPRYHAYFDNISGRNILRYRRENGLKAGNPIRPDEVEAEEQRLKARGLVPVG